MPPTALVTGASRGIGAELAKLLAADGHDLVLVARTLDDLELLASDLRERHGISVHVIAEDLADAQAPARICTLLDQEGVEVDVLVNNAGFGTTGAFHELPVERELMEVQVNIAALVALTGLLLPGMVSRGKGRVLNIGSTAGFQCGPYMATYYATKAFVNSFTEALSHELDGTGVTATVHCPGATDTAFKDVSGNGKSKLFTTQTPATVEDVAQHAYAAMKAGKRMAVHGAMNWIGAFGVRFTPRWLTASIASTLNRP